MKTFLKQCRWGQFLLIEGDLICNYVKVLGHWCDVEVDLFRALLPESGGVCIEVGANIGMHAVPLSKLCTGGELICYEPQRPIFHVLCANLALNNCMNVRTRRAAVGEAPGRIEIETSDYDAPWNYGSFSISRGFGMEGNYSAPVKTETVELASLDADPELAHLTRLDLLKIDAEGHELGVLAGARETIARFRPNIFVEPSTVESVDALRDFMAPLGYEGHWFAGQRYGPDDDYRPDPGPKHYDINILFRQRGAPSFGLTPLVSGQDFITGLPVIERFGRV